MLAATRQSEVMATVRISGAARVVDLAQAFDVSEMTIRRDIQVLVGAGLLQKVHGGAAIPGTLSSDEPGFEKKSVREEAEKSAIASEAVSFVTAGSAIGLGAGTTTWTLAKSLAQMRGLTIVTNSIQVADVFYRASAQSAGAHNSVILTGGQRTPSDALVGPIAISALHQLHLDVLFLGVHGMDERAGFTTPNLLEAETDRAFAATARKVIVVADHTKWGVVGMSTIAGLGEADVLVTDDGLSGEAQKILGDKVPLLRIAAIAATSPLVKQPS
ncbi:DeoR/GlpR family DNA-binding transcription regulator [Parafrigoribacterium mesophilum]|uniref:DeoR/GlpR family DNA-binding transcription regulator n=1 Tax=Parafrigoribacterium mesophilum TaxID=433646 RepID=UPI0031FC4D07